MFRPIEPISKACYSIAKSIQDLKRKLGIDKVDNTSDEEKPVSRPTQNMINSLAVDLTHQINEAKEGVETVESAIVVINGTLTTHSRTIAELVSHKDILYNRIATLTDTVDGIGTEVDTMSDSIYWIRNVRIPQLQGAIDTNSTFISSVSGRVTALESLFTKEY